MPKKRQAFKSFKPYSSASPAPSSKNPDQTRSVNDLLADSRRASAGPSTAVRDQPANAPSVPPAIREILQIPETPSPASRRPGRARFDGSGRRLPAGPPPPRSWLSRVISHHGSGNNGTTSLSMSSGSFGELGTLLPGTRMPERGSLMDIVLRKLALDWDFHRVYNQYYLYYLPNHIKPALIRQVGLNSGHGIDLSDLKLILLPPEDVYGSDDEVDDNDDSSVNLNTEVTYLDLSGSIGRSVKIKEVTDLLFPLVSDAGIDEPQDSWDTVADKSPSPPRVLLPNLTHLSLALDPTQPSKASWKQLLSLSSKASAITHLSLANWPAPCFTPRARSSTVTSPQGQRIAYGGTNVYSHSLDQDWSEALLILRKLSRNFYKLEYLDLTGCGSWFRALAMKTDHDYIDWTSSWGKVTHLRLQVGWKPVEDTLTSEQMAYVEATEEAAKVERHIRAMRAGQGRFITVERDG